jgi:leucyl aminopeptidase (aminopeptidase T)
MANEPYKGVPDRYFDLVKSYAYWLDLTRGMAIHTKLSRDYLNSGGHFLGLCDIIKDGFIKGILDLDVDDVLKTVRKLTLLFKMGKQLRIKSEIGTDLNISIVKNSISFSRVSQLMEGKNIEITPCGYVFIPIEILSVDGTIVVNDYIWPPNDLCILNEPIEVEIKNGRIVNIKNTVYSQRLVKWLDAFADPRVREIAHLTYGILPDILLSRSLIMNERISGMLSFGFGNAWDEDCPTHIDMLCSSTSIWLDNICIQDRGKVLFKSLI